MNIKAMVALAATLAMVSAAQARTVAWYHFNEGENGAVMDGGEGVYAVVNAVEPTSLGGRAYQIAGSAFGLYDSGNYMPLWTNGMPSCVSWYDPVTGMHGEDNRCMWVRSSGDTGARTASIVLVDDDPSLHCRYLTAECMVKMPEGKSLSADWSSILVMRNNGSGSLAWGIRAQKNGRMLVQCQDVNNSANNFDGSSLGSGRGGNGYFYTPAPGGGIPNFLDGKWHHLAITYDGARVRAYIDYAEIESIAWSNGLVYGSSGSTSKLCIGGFDGASYGNWPGCIDEVRISDVALDPSQFIRAGALCPKASAVTDADTALYLPFDAVELCTDPFFGTVGAPIVHNAASISNSPKVNVMLPSSYLLPTGAASTVANVVHGGIFATNSAANSGCWDFGVNSALYGRSIHMTVNDYSASDRSHSITAGDFTMEFFLNIHSKPSSLRYIAREQAASSGTAWTLYFSGSGDRLCFSVNDGSAAKSIYSGALVYGEWHHVACVVNRAARTAALYVDGALQGMEEGFDLLFPAGDVADCLKICGGYGATQTDQFHDLSVDELRITKRALAPQEFLAAGVNGTTALEPTRAWVGFEGDLSVEPRPDEIPAGVKSANAVFSDVVWGNGKILDGAENLLRSSNTKSMWFSGVNEKTMFGRNVLLEKDMESQTVEFFMKAPKDSAREWAYMLRAYSAPMADCQSSASDSANIMSWTIGYGGATVANPTFRSGEVYVGAVTADFPTSSVTRNFNDVEGEDAKLDDGFWHHVAVTFEPNDTTNTLVSFYKDYKRCGTPKSINGRMKQIVGVTESCLGMGCNFTGWIDEVRISKGVLTVDEMLHVQKRGAVVTFR